MRKLRQGEIETQRQRERDDLDRIKVLLVSRRHENFASRDKRRLQSMRAKLMHLMRNSNNNNNTNNTDYNVPNNLDVRISDDPTGILGADTFYRANIRVGADDNNEVDNNDNNINIGSNNNANADDNNRVQDNDSKHSRKHMKRARDEDNNVNTNRNNQGTANTENTSNNDHSKNNTTPKHPSSNGNNSNNNDINKRVRASLIVELSHSSPAVTFSGYNTNTNNKYADNNVHNHNHNAANNNNNKQRKIILKHSVRQQITTQIQRLQKQRNDLLASGLYSASNHIIATLSHRIHYLHQMLQGSIATSSS